MTVEQYDKAESFIKAIRDLEKALKQLKKNTSIQVNVEEWDGYNERFDFNRVILPDTMLESVRNHLIEQITTKIEEYKKMLAEI